MNYFGKNKFIFVLFLILTILISSQLIASNKSLSAMQTRSKKIITLDFKKIPLRELLQFVAEAMKYNVIMSDSITGFISLHFHDVTWGVALDAILEMSGLVKKQKGTLLFIATPHEFALRQKNLEEALPMKTVKIILHHTDVNLVGVTLKAQNNLLSSLAKLSINPRENSLLIKENEENLPSVLSFIHQLDQAEKQLLISAKIINIDDKKISELGLNFQSADKSRSLGDLNISMPDKGVNSFQISIAKLNQNQLLNLQLSALEATGHSKIIADPKLITQNHKTAVIEAGEEIPYQESTTSGATSITFRKAALSLKVTPTILPDGQIILELEISQNKVSPLEVNGTPAIQTQELKSQVVVRDCQTVILGGIFEQSNSMLQHKLPLIGKLPLVGEVLSHKEQHHDRKQLLIFISPHIIE